MKIVFFGTPYYVIPILDVLHKTFRSKAVNSPIVAVVTQKPRPFGRKKALTYSPVDKWAHKNNVDIIYSQRDIPSADIGVLAAYGEILPKKILNNFPHGILNIHPSLLPKFRGASPVQATILTGEEAGATIIKIDEHMDHGPIVARFKDEVTQRDTTESLRNRLFEKSAEVLTTLIPAYLNGKIKLQEQDHKNATYTTLLKKDYGFIPTKYLQAVLEGKSHKVSWDISFIKNFTLQPTPGTLHRFVRAMQPWPQAWTKVRIKNNELRLKILKVHLKPSIINHQQLIIDEVQLEGKNPVSWSQFKSAYPNASFI